MGLSSSVAHIVNFRLNGGQPLKERICSLRSKFFPLKVDPILDGFVIQESKKECVLFVLFLLFVVVWSGEPKHNQGRGLVDRKLIQVPSNLIAGRPRAALLFWFFGDFRCGVPLSIGILLHVYINIKIGKNRC